MKKKKSRKPKKKNKKKYNIAKLYHLISIVEQKKEFLFIVGKGCGDEITIDVLCYDTEDTLDGGWFKNVKKAYFYIKYFYC